MSDGNGAECGLGEGTHYGCECVMRRLASAEERARALDADLERAMTAMSEAGLALNWPVTDKDAVLRDIDAAYCALYRQFAERLAGARALAAKETSP